MLGSRPSTNCLLTVLNAMLLVSSTVLLSGWAPINASGNVPTVRVSNVGLVKYRVLANLCNNVVPILLTFNRSRRRPVTDCELCGPSSVVTIPLIGSFGNRLTRIAVELRRPTVLWTGVESVQTKSFLTLAVATMYLFSCGMLLPNLTVTPPSGVLVNPSITNLS